MTRSLAINQKKVNSLNVLFVNIPTENLAPPLGLLYLANSIKDRSFINSYKTMLGKTTLKVGSKVWVVQKTKKTEGVVTKMNIKKAIVEMSNGNYNVPFAMLELR